MRVNDVVGGYEAKVRENWNGATRSTDRPVAKCSKVKAT